MFVVGGIFAVLWFIAVRTGRRVDALREAAQAEASAQAGVDAQSEESAPSEGTA
jgi:hypothetical protein